MSDWLDEFRKKNQDKLTEEVRSEQIREEKERSREVAYLKNKARIDAKISEI